MGIGIGALFSADAGFVGQIIQNAVTIANTLRRKSLTAIETELTTLSHASPILFIHAIFL
jgi:hypothetical protein